MSSVADPGFANGRGARSSAEAARIEATKAPRGLGLERGVPLHNGEESEEGALSPLRKLLRFCVCRGVGLERGVPLPNGEDSEEGALSPPRKRLRFCV